MVRGIFDGFNSDKAKKKVSDLIKQQMIKNKGKLDMKAVLQAQREKPDYDAVMEQRIEEYKKKMLIEAKNRTSVQLPGTEAGSNELSEKAKAAIEEMARIKAKKDAKRKKMMQAFHDDGPGKKKDKDKKKTPLNFMAAKIGGGGADPEY